MNLPGFDNEYADQIGLDYPQLQWTGAKQAADDALFGQGAYESMSEHDLYIQMQMQDYQQQQATVRQPIPNQQEHQYYEEAQFPLSPVSQAGPGDQYTIDFPEGPVDYKRDDWTYAIDCSPVIDGPGENYVSDHIVAIQEALSKNKIIDWNWTILAHPRNSSNCVRRYWLNRKLRSDERARLAFIQVFSANKPYNQVLPNYKYEMSVVYEPRQLIHTDTYPSIELEHDGGDHVRYGDHDVSDLGPFANGPASPLMPSPAPDGFPATPEAIALPETNIPPPSMPTPTDDVEIPKAARAKAVGKIDRTETRNSEGKLICTWQGCTEESRVFNRKCEWGKHMDKHERPYRCLVVGCEKLPGFTYSGGLLRHEREVHKKHGGPKNPLNCPHLNCKRHSGKGFSRLENLNEHLRRVHTNGTASAGTPSVEPEDHASVSLGENVGIGQKRKPDDDLREEVKRLRAENQRLTQENAAQKAHQAAMMGEIQNLRDRLNPLADLQFGNEPYSQ